MDVVINYLRPLDSPSYLQEYPTLCLFPVKLALHELQKGLN